MLRLHQRADRLCHRADLRCESRTGTQRDRHRAGLFPAFFHGRASRFQGLPYRCAHLRRRRGTADVRHAHDRAERPHLSGPAPFCRGAAFPRLDDPRRHALRHLRRHQRHGPRDPSGGRALRCGSKVQGRQALPHRAAFRPAHRRDRGRAADQAHHCGNEGSASGPDRLYRRPVQPQLCGRVPRRARSRCDPKHSDGGRRQVGRPGQPRSRAGRCRAGGVLRRVRYLAAGQRLRRAGRV